jgi:uncharacterized protein YbjQ (UPF0145 family)
MDVPFEQGGLPDKARQRIDEARARGGSFFTSTFTTAEMAIARVAGYEPIGQVMGSSIYHVGWQWTSLYDGEMRVLNHAQREARLLALSRLAQEASRLGAHAVVGVELTTRGYEWAGDLMEFTAIGTAVCVSGQARGGGNVALTHLTAQQLYKLELAGLWPVGIAVGNCAWYAQHADCVSEGNWWNQLLPVHTACIDNARAAAVERFRGEVAQLRGAGAVGVEVKRSFKERHWEQNDRHHTSFQAEVILTGTAVVRRAQPKLPRPRLVLDLLDGRTVQLDDASPTEK